MSISGLVYADVATDLINKVNDKVNDLTASTGTSGTAIAALLNLLGVTEEAQNTEQQNLIFSLLQKKDKQSKLATGLLKNYLQGLKSRLQKWKKDTNTSRINKITRLLGNDEAIPETGITDEDNLDVAIQKVQKYQKQVADTKETLGELNVQVALYNTATEKVNSLVSALPLNQFGEFGSEIASLVKTDSDFIRETSLKLERRKQALQTELNSLKFQDGLINTGVQLSESSDKLSLAKIVDTILYLITSVNYECSECFYFKSNKCAYGGNNLETKPNQSCLNVYNRIDNPFWRISNNTFQKVQEAVV